MSFAFAGVCPIGTGVISLSLLGSAMPSGQSLRQMVCLRDVIEESRKETEKMHIPIFLGKDVMVSIISDFLIGFNKKN